jgi:hypothetical protein
MIVYSSRFLTRGEVWYDDESGNTRLLDWIFYSLRSHPAPGARWKYFHNYVIDLTQTTVQLLKQLNEDTAYKIRRARDRDKIICESCDASNPAVLDRFEEMYNPFAAMKGLQPMNRARLNAMAAVGALDLSVARDAQGNVLVWHANYRDHRRASQTFSASHYRQLDSSAARNLIGRANRYLIWSDMLRYKEQGLQGFDFAGWYPGTTDPALLNINEFKKGFGGQVIREYECEQILTLKGWVVLNTAKLLKRARLLRSAPKAQARQPATVEGQQPVAAAST